MNDAPQSGPELKPDDLRLSLLRYFRAREGKYQELLIAIPLGDPERVWYQERVEKLRKHILALEALKETK